MKKTKGNLERGITLVALIITIIVMLILVAVTVAVVVDSDIIGQAEETAKLYENAHKEDSIGNIKINGEEYASINEYFKITFTIDGTEYTAEKGMTWAEWISSDYSKGEFEKFSNQADSSICRVGTEECITYEYAWDLGWSDATVIKTNEEIIAHDYYTLTAGHEGFMF